MARWPLRANPCCCCARHEGTVAAMTDKQVQVKYMVAGEPREKWVSLASKTDTIMKK